MRRKDMQDLLAERAERILLLEQRLENSDNIIDNYRNREQAIVDSMASAQIEAARRISEAEARASQLEQRATLGANAAMQEAGAKAEQTLAQAQAQAETWLSDAQRQADEIVEAARARSASILSHTRAAVAEYEERLNRYNESIACSAAEVREWAERFAAFAGAKKQGQSSLSDEMERLDAAVNAEPVALPDNEGDPAKLMRNIYTLQQRDLPGEAFGQPAVSPREPEIVQELATETAPLEEQAPVEAQAAIEEETPVEEQPSASEPEEEAFADLAAHPVADWQPEDEAAEPEWQPDDEEDVPTVRDLMPDLPVEDEVEMSLDALLDEIIRAGE